MEIDEEEKEEVEDNIYKAAGNKEVLNNYQTNNSIQYYLLFIYIYQCLNIVGRR